jgi:uncharacterized membrane protein YkoI
MNMTSKKVLIPAIVAAVAIGAIFVVPSAVAFAQEQEMSRNVPQINGTINAREAMQDYLDENVDVTFAVATETAQGEVEDGTIVAGHLGVVQGYVVYKFFIVDTESDTGYMTIIDAGNGDVLYTSEGMQMKGMGFGHGFGGWHGGPWKGQGGFGHGGFWNGAGWR